MVGGLLHWFRHRKRSGESADDPGVLFSSGLIAGEALTGIAFALFATAGVNYGIGTGKLGGATQFVTAVAYILLVLSLWRAARLRSA